MSIINYNQGIACLFEDHTVRVWERTRDFIMLLNNPLSLATGVTICDDAVSIKRFDKGCLILTYDNTIIVSTEDNIYHINIPNNYDQIINYESNRDIIIVCTSNTIYFYKLEDKLKLEREDYIDDNISIIKNQNCNSDILQVVFITDKNDLYHYKLYANKIYETSNKNVCNSIDEKIIDIQVFVDAMKYDECVYILTENGKLYNWFVQDNVSEIKPIEYKTVHNLFEDSPSPIIRKIVYDDLVYYDIKLISDDNICWILSNTNEKHIYEPIFSSVSNVWNGQLVNFYERTDGEILMVKKLMVKKLERTVCSFKEKINKLHIIKNINYGHMFIILENGQVYYEFTKNEPYRKVEYFDSNRLLTKKR